MKEAGQEIKINPEIVKGGKFRMPYIVALPDGTYQVENLHLLEGWQKSYFLGHAMQDSRQIEFFQGDCHSVGFDPGEVIFDEETGLLLEARIKQPETKLVLSSIPEELEKGVYKLENAKDLVAAIILVKYAGGIFSVLKEGMDLAGIKGKAKYFWIDGWKQGFYGYPPDLSEFLGFATNLTEEFKKNFQEKGRQIARSFGVGTQKVLEGGDDIWFIGDDLIFHLTGGRSFAFPDGTMVRDEQNPDRVAAGFAISAAFFNDVLDLVEGQE